MTASNDLPYKVEGMSCGHCKAAVTEEVEQLEGVSAVDVDLDARHVTVRGDEVSEVAVLKAIADAGYEARAA